MVLSKVSTLFPFSYSMFWCSTLGNSNVFSSILWQFCSIMLASLFLLGRITTVGYTTIIKLTVGLQNCVYGMPSLCILSDQWIAKSLRWPCSLKYILLTPCGLHSKSNPLLYTFQIYENLSAHVFMMWWQRQATRKTLHLIEMDALVYETNALHMILHPGFSWDSTYGIPDSWEHTNLWSYLERVSQPFAPARSRSWISLWLT
jgi:hypothetical protein